MLVDPADVRTVRIAGRWLALINVSVYCTVAVIDAATIAHLVPRPIAVVVNSLELISMCVVLGVVPCIMSVASGISIHTAADIELVVDAMATKRFLDICSLPWEVSVPT